MNLTREHIIFTLGIELPLNESFDNLSEDLKKRIISEQIIYENFIDSIKKYASEKWDKVVTTITDWKDAAVILGKIITDPEILSGFSGQLWKYFKSNILNNLINLLKKLKLDSYIPQIQNVVDKITTLTGWQKFLAASSLASITQYILTELSNLSVEGLIKWIKSYFSSEIISTITSKLTDFSTYIGWLQPIIKGTEILYNILKPTIDKFKYAFNQKPITQTENNMKKSQLKQLIKEEISRIIEAEVAPATTTLTPPEKLQGSNINIELFTTLAPNVNSQSITSAMNSVKQGKSLTPAINKTLADIMVAMIKTSDDALLTKILANLKQIGVK